MKSNGFKARFILMLVAVLVLSLVGCTQPANNAGVPRTNFSVMSAAPGGNWYNMSGGLASLLTEKIDGYSFSLEATGGSVENARRFMANESDLGPIYSSHLYELSKGGIGVSEGLPPSDAATILCQIYDSSHYFVTLKGSGITCMQDLQGKTVAVGPAGSGTTDNSLRVLDVLGIEVNEVECSYGDAARQLQDGKIDALGQGGHPASGIMELAATQDILIIPFSDEELDQIVELAPYFFKGEIPANTYNGQDEAVPVFCLNVYLAAHKDMPEDVVYNILEVLFSKEGQEYLAAVHPQWANVCDNPEAIKALGVPYHPGAAKYWAEH